MKGLGIKKAHVVGLSLGWFVATDFMALYLAEALSVVAASGDVLPVPGPSQLITEADITQLQTRGIDAFKADWLAGLLKSSGPARANTGPLLRLMVGEWTACQPLHVEPRLLLGNDLLPHLKAHPVRAPYLLLTPEYGAANGQAGLYQLLKLVPGARNVIMPRAGHVSNLDNPTGFTQIVLDFFASVSH